MPFAKQIETEAGHIGIWAITETSSELLSHFSFSLLEEFTFNTIKAEKRKIEFIVTRLILYKLLGHKTEIEYLNSGKPKLKNNNLHISISHSANAVAVIVSEQKNGIDVELTTRNIDRVATRFLSKDEFDHVQKLEKSQLAKIIYWGAKESIFKCSDFEGVNFYKQIHVHPFPVESKGKFTGELIAEDITEYFKLWYFTFQNNMVVYCVEDKNKS